jgi:hypothetical protein
LSWKSRWFRPFCHSSPIAQVDRLSTDCRRCSLSDVNPVSTASNTRLVQISVVSVSGLGTRSGREAEAREFQIPSERLAPLPNNDRQDTTLTTTIETQTTPVIVPRPQDNKASLAPKLESPLTRRSMHTSYYTSWCIPILLHHSHSNPRMPRACGIFHSRFP